MKYNIMTWRKFILPYIESNMYIWKNDNYAIVIDPHISEEAISYIGNYDDYHVLILLTHEHADHISGINFFKEHFKNVVVIAQRACATSIKNVKNNRPIVLLTLLNDENYSEIMKAYKSWPLGAFYTDIQFQDVYQIRWGIYNIKMISVPGHSPGSILIIMNNYIVFSGDYMIPNCKVILRYPGGSVIDYNKITLPKLLLLPTNSIIMPGHGNEYCFKDMVYRDGAFRHW